MKKSQLITSVILAGAIATGCKPNNTTVELSDIITEKATVSQKTYSAARTTTNLVFIGDTFIPITETVPEKYRIAFDGEIDFQRTDKATYESFSPGEKVIISYRMRKETSSDIIYGPMGSAPLTKITKSYEYVTATKERENARNNN